MNFKNKYVHLVVGLIYLSGILYLSYWAKIDHKPILLVLSLFFIGLPFNHFKKFVNFGQAVK